MKRILFLLFSIVFTNFIFSIDLNILFNNHKIETTEAIVTINGTNMYKKQDLSSEILNTLKIGEVVTILSCSSKATEINNTFDYWYEIEFGQIKGYIYGINLNTYEKINIINSKKVGKLIVNNSSKIIDYNSLEKVIVNRLNNNNKSDNNIYFERIKVLSDNIYSKTYMYASEIPTGHSTIKKIEIINTEDKIIFEQEKDFEYKYSNKNELLIIQDIVDYHDPGTEYSKIIKIYNKDGDFIKKIKIGNEIKYKDFMFHFERIILSDNYYCWTNNSSLVVLDLRNLNFYQAYYQVGNSEYSIGFEDIKLSNNLIDIKLTQSKGFSKPDNLRFVFEVNSKGLLLVE